MGGRTSALLRFLLAATRFLHRDGYAALTARLRGLHADLGQGFAAQLALGESQSSLTISRCLYHDIFAEEGQPQLATACCCTQDQVRQAAACPAAARPHCSLHAEGAACPHAAHAPQISATQATHEATAVPGAPPPPSSAAPTQHTHTITQSHTHHSELSCCSLPCPCQVWFEPRYRGVEAGRTSAISAGHPCCRFSVRRVPPR